MTAGAANQENRSDSAVAAAASGVWEGGEQMAHRSAGAHSSWTWRWSE